MAVLLSDLKYYAAAVTPEDDTATAVGGAIDTAKKYDFADFAGTPQVVSANTGDTTQTVTVTYRDVHGAVQTVALALNGQTVVTNAAVFERILKAVKSATCAGDVALESQAAVHTGTLAALGPEADQVQLDSGASSVDGAYTGMVFRATGGTGNHKIAEIIDYVGGTKIATLSRSVATDFDATTTFRISSGMFFDKTPAEISTVVRHDETSQADPFGGTDRAFYQKGFFKHTDASGSGLSLTSCVVTKAGGPSTLTFALDTALNAGTPTTNGTGNNRQVAPTTGVSAFDASDKAIPGGGVLAPGDTLGVWPKLARAAGAAALKTTWTPGLQGLTV